MPTNNRLSSVLDSDSELTGGGFAEWIGRLPGTAARDGLMGRGFARVKEITPLSRDKGIQA